MLQLKVHHIVTEEEERQRSMVFSLQHHEHPSEAWYGHMDPSTKFFLMCLLPKKGYSYSEPQNLGVNKAYNYELNLLGVPFGVALKSSPRFIMS